MSTSEQVQPVAIITGGSRGLGFEVARGLAARGYEIALIARDAIVLPQRATLYARSFRTHR
jgi:3-oxoacyl-[acyl-carrier protein] reductase